MDRVNRALLQYAQQAAAANPTESDAVVEEEEEVEVEPPKPEDAADIILRLIEEKAYFEYVPRGRCMRTFRAREPGGANGAACPRSH
jgi:hypothetical protein